MLTKAFVLEELHLVKEALQFSVAEKLCRCEDVFLNKPENDFCDQNVFI